MPTILCAMSERTYDRMMNPALEAQLHALGEVFFVFRRTR